MKTDKLPTAIRKLLARRRSSRVAFMLSKVNVSHRMKVIDIGCGRDGRSFDHYVPTDWTITGIDLWPPDQVNHVHPNYTYLQQDAQDLSRFSDHEFDLAVSIGMLEHITEEDTFRNIVSEIRRVARQYVVVVPYKYCWIEPHYGVPFFPLFPYSLKVATVKVFNLSGHRQTVTDDPEYIRKHYRWLSNAEYQVEFPDSVIHVTPTRETIAITRSA